MHLEQSSGINPYRNTNGATVPSMYQASLKGLTLKCSYFTLYAFSEGYNKMYTFKRARPLTFHSGSPEDTLKTPQCRQAKKYQARARKSLPIQWTTSGCTVSLNL